MRMICTERVEYDKRVLRPDDEFEAVSAGDARILSLLGKARLADGGDIEEVVRKPMRKKRKYRRRDQRAEDE